MISKDEVMKKCKQIYDNVPGVTHEDKQHYVHNQHIEWKLNLCKGCERIEDCKQDLPGQIPTLRHSDMSIIYEPCSKLRGKCNSPLVRESRYNSIDIPQFRDIQQHVKRRRGFYVWGDTGVGKTHLMYYAANHNNKKGREVYIDTFGNMLTDYKAQFNTGNVYLREYLKEVPILYIDDLGSEYTTSFALSEFLFPILDHRYINRKPTFITSNLNLYQLMNKYIDVVIKGENLDEFTASRKIAPIIDRIKSWGEIEIKGKNRR